MSKRIAPSTKYVTREKVLVEAIDVAREALLEVVNERYVGEHAGVIVEAERVVTHLFTCNMDGYKGWYWVSTVTRAKHRHIITVNEVALRPGSDALLAPEWVPWNEQQADK